MQHSLHKQFPINNWSHRLNHISLQLKELEMFKPNNVSFDKRNFNPSSSVPKSWSFCLYPPTETVFKINWTCAHAHLENQVPWRYHFAEFTLTSKTSGILSPVTWITNFTLPKILMLLSSCYNEKLALTRYNFIHWVFLFCDNWTEITKTDSLSCQPVPSLDSHLIFEDISIN
jgi:hypothetical protein